MSRNVPFTGKLRACKIAADFPLCLHVLFVGIYGGPVLRVAGLWMDVGDIGGAITLVVFALWGRADILAFGENSKTPLSLYIKLETSLIGKQAYRNLHTSFDNLPMKT